MRKPAFLDLSEPVSGDYLVAWLGKWCEVPDLFVVERACVLSLLVVL